jgi:hypothetical protein
VKRKSMKRKKKKIYKKKEIINLKILTNMVKRKRVAKRDKSFCI